MWEIIVSCSQSNYSIWNISTNKDYTAYNLIGRSLYGHAHACVKIEFLIHMIKFDGFILILNIKVSVIRAPALKFTSDRSHIIIFNRYDAIFVASATLDEAAWKLLNMFLVCREHPVSCLTKKKASIDYTFSDQLWGTWLISNDTRST